MRLLPVRHRPKIVALMSLEPGTRLGPYEIAVPIGAGGMGEVYKAKDTRLELDRSRIHVITNWNELVAQMVPGEGN